MPNNMIIFTMPCLVFCLGIIRCYIKGKGFTTKTHFKIKETNYNHNRTISGTQQSLFRITSRTEK